MGQAWHWAQFHFLPTLRTAGSGLAFPRGEYTTERYSDSPKVTQLGSVTVKAELDWNPHLVAP